MATKSKKTRARWDSEVERKLIDIWADILKELDRKMMTRKKKEAIGAGQENDDKEEERGNRDHSPQRVRLQ